MSKSMIPLLAVGAVAVFMFMQSQSAAKQTADLQAEIARLEAEMDKADREDSGGFWGGLGGLLDSIF